MTPPGTDVTRATAASELGPLTPSAVNLGSVRLLQHAFLAQTPLKHAAFASELKRVDLDLISAARSPTQGRVPLRSA